MGTAVLRSHQLISLSAMWKLSVPGGLGALSCLWAKARLDLLLGLSSRLPTERGIYLSVEKEMSPTWLPRACCHHLTGWLSCRRWGASSGQKGSYDTSVGGGGGDPFASTQCSGLRNVTFISPNKLTWSLLECANLLEGRDTQRQETLPRQQGEVRPVHTE